MREEGEKRKGRGQLRRWMGVVGPVQEAAESQCLVLGGSTHLLHLAGRREQLQLLTLADSKMMMMRREKVRLQRSWQNLQIHPESPKKRLPPGA